MNVFARIWLERKANVPAFSSYISEKELEDLRASRTAESQNDDKAEAAEDNKNSTTKTSTVGSDKDSNTIEINPEDFEVKSETEAATEAETTAATTAAPSAEKESSGGIPIVLIVVIAVVVAVAVVVTIIVLKNKKRFY